ncbi:MAG: fumarate hydratase [Actinomycetota bacterium]|nr:fumarate hydratase [Actinomycetota bacterium]MDI6821642.1 fumarate hydratase [Actinomycetota bacterium]
MREIEAGKITDVISYLCKEANFSLPDDVLSAIKTAKLREESPMGKEVLSLILENAQVAEREKIPLCQDTGCVIVFLELGQEVIIKGDIYRVIDEGVRRGYEEGYLRKSMVKDTCFSRENTGDNTPAIVHMEIVPGDALKIIVMPKGSGSENMSRLSMLKPAEGVEGIIDFVVETVEIAGPNSCPPLIVGVGIGGSFEMAAYLAKKALLRKVQGKNPSIEVANLERELLERINHLGIGPQGFGGRITALAVHVETFPTHMASLPVAVNLNCYAARRKGAIL